MLYPFFKKVISFLVKYHFIKAISSNLEVPLLIRLTIIQPYVVVVYYVYC